MSIAYFTRDQIKQSIIDAQKKLEAAQQQANSAPDTYNRSDIIAKVNDAAQQLKEAKDNFGLDNVDLGNDFFNTRTIGGTPYPTDIGSNADQITKWTWGVLNRCGVVGFENATLEKATWFQHQDRMPFSPFTVDLTTPDNLLILALAVKGMTKENFKQFVSLASSYMSNMSKIIDSISVSGNANWANHTSSMMLLAGVLHRFGMLDDAGFIKMADHARSVFDKMYNKDLALGCLGGVTTMINGSRLSSGDDGLNSGGLASLLPVIAKAVV